MPSRSRRKQEPEFLRVDVAEVFANVPPAARDVLLQLRALIFETAAATPGVGPIEEALRWGEPSYLTSETKAGTTIRIHWKEKRPEHCAMYVHCQTKLIDVYRQAYGDSFDYEGNRAILLAIDEPLAEDTLRHCIQLALTYHLR